MFKMRINVVHNGKAYDKGSECPEGLAKLFGDQGLLEAMDVPAQVEPVQEKPKEEPKSKKDKASK